MYLDLTVSVKKEAERSSASFTFQKMIRLTSILELSKVETRTFLVFASNSDN